MLLTGILVQYIGDTRWAHKPFRHELVGYGYFWSLNRRNTTIYRQSWRGNMVQRRAKIYEYAVCVHTQIPFPKSTTLPLYDDLAFPPPSTLRRCLIMYL